MQSQPSGASDFPDDVGRFFHQRAFHWPHGFGQMEPGEKRVSARALQ
ncbi:MAG TPA: hypothetical protein IAB51_00245 [Candidatus Merdivicinus excrementipullorum]|uniref:Uncharacterized protein n=1 Tax=Candidatus Merdivicinus excrementipullorum TaxID=2840867 RepID=A0A9D1JYZ6_9FIRM|nr:hypothetical protein [Candidatus Merdivicinus excrementipullorum]